MPTRVESPPAASPSADVAERLDRLSAQVEDLAMELRAQREARQRWSELVEELTPVAQGVMTVLERELQDLSTDVTADDAARFVRTVARSLPRLEVLIARLDSLAELMSDVTSLAGASVGRLSDTLATAQQKGYFDLVQAAAGALRADGAQAGGAQAGGGRAPSTLALLRRLRDPRVRRGLARVLAVVGALGTEPDTNPPTHTQVPTSQRGTP